MYNCLERHNSNQPTTTLCCLFYLLCLSVCLSSACICFRKNPVASTHRFSCVFLNTYICTGSSSTWWVVELLFCPVIV